MILSGVIFTLIASSKKPKYKPEVEFDDLAPGLRIDLGFYLPDDYMGCKLKRKRKEEMLSLLNS